jgi:hypothetical protein
LQAPSEAYEAIVLEYLPCRRPEASDQVVCSNRSRFFDAIGLGSGDLRFLRFLSSHGVAGSRENVRQRASDSHFSA